MRYLDRVLPACVQSPCRRSIAGLPGTGSRRASGCSANAETVPVQNLGRRHRAIDPGPRGSPGHRSVVQAGATAVGWARRSLGTVATLGTRSMLGTRVMAAKSWAGRSIGSRSTSTARQRGHDRQQVHGREAVGRQQLCVDRRQVHVDRLGTTTKIDIRFTLGAVMMAAATSTLAILEVDSRARYG